MKRITQISIVMAALLLVGLNGHAASSSWKLDPAHSGFYFSIDHIFSKVQGFFDEYDSNIQFDPDNLEASQFTFRIDVKSINTNHTKRDNDLLSKAFFNAREYPHMSFKSSQVSHVKEGSYMVEGMLTIKDVSKKLKVPFTFFGVKPNPFNPKEEVAGFEARMTIDRLAFNVGNGKFYTMGTMGKDVDILITMEATRKK